MPPEAILPGISVRGTQIGAPPLHPASCRVEDTPRPGRTYLRQAESAGARCLESTQPTRSPPPVRELHLAPRLLTAAGKLDASGLRLEHMHDRGLERRLLVHLEAVALRHAGHPPIGRQRGACAVAV